MSRRAAQRASRRLKVRPIAISPTSGVRQARAEEIIARLRKQVGSVQGISLFMQAMRPGAHTGLIEGPPYHCDINAMREVNVWGIWRETPVF